MSDADRQILFGLVAIRLKLVSLPQVSRALADWSIDGQHSLARLLIERGQLDLASGALVESAVEHHVAMAGGDAASSLEPFSGSEDLEALRHVMERTIKPVPPNEKTVARGDARRCLLVPLAMVGQSRGKGPSWIWTRTTRSHGTLIHDGVSAGAADVRDPQAAGRGGLGEVFVARDGRLNREVALKLIEESQAADAQSRGPILARGRNHRRARAPRHRAGLRPGREQRRPSVLRDAAGSG